MDFKKFLLLAIGAITIKTQLYCMEQKSDFFLSDFFLNDLKQYLSYATLFPQPVENIFHHSENFFTLVQNLQTKRELNLQDCCKLIILYLDEVNVKIINFSIMEAKTISSVKITEDDIFHAKIILCLFGQSDLKDYYYEQIKGKYLNLSIILYELKKDVYIQITILIDKANFTTIAKELPYFNSDDLKKILKTDMAENCIIQ